jgi:hypothetical protein
LIVHSSTESPTGTFGQMGWSNAYILHIVVPITETGWHRYDRRLVRQHRYRGNCYSHGRTGTRLPAM